MQTHPNGGGDLTDDVVVKLAKELWVMTMRVQMDIAAMLGRKESISDADAYGLAIFQAIMAAIGRPPAPGESVLSPSENEGESTHG